jgi:hypothetical protein
MMIKHKIFETSKRKNALLHVDLWEGWYLFGFIPLYIRCIKHRETL